MTFLGVKIHEPCQKITKSNSKNYELKNNPKYTPSIIILNWKFKQKILQKSAKKKIQKISKFLSESGEKFLYFRMLFKGLWLAIIATLAVAQSRGIPF